jgi:hypothetical protein
MSEQEKKGLEGGKIRYGNIRVGKFEAIPFTRWVTKFQTDGLIAGYGKKKR